LETKTKRGRPKGSKTKVEKKEEVAPSIGDGTSITNTTPVSTVTVETETLDTK
jgi:hypothetical protein